MWAMIMMRRSRFQRKKIVMTPPVIKNANEGPTPYYKCPLFTNSSRFDHNLIRKMDISKLHRDKITGECG
jgi:hypothetical protein